VATLDPMEVMTTSMSLTVLIALVISACVYGGRATVGLLLDTGSLVEDITLVPIAPVRVCVYWRRAVVLAEGTDSVAIIVLLLIPPPPPAPLVEVIVFEYWGRAVKGTPTDSMVGIPLPLLTL